MQKFDYVIIGNGICGVTAAETLRGKDAEASIAIVDQENNPLYSRVLLPNYIEGKISREALFLRDEAFYRKNNIVFFGGETAVKLGSDENKVYLASGEEIEYGKLLLASGGHIAKPSIPGIDLKNIHFFRTIFDADDIIETIKQIKELPQEKQKIVIWGGGFIGLEFASSFAACGIGGYVVIRRPYYMGDRLDADSANLLSSFIENNRFKIINNSYITEILGTDTVEGVKLNSGEILECSSVGLGLGLDLNSDFFAGSGLKITKGIETNERLETSVKDIYAGGDVANSFQPSFGKHLSIGSWTNALFHGKIAGQNMFGEKSSIDFISSYSGVYFGINIIFMGDTSADKDTITVSRGENESLGGGTGWHEQFFFRDNLLVGATIINRSKDRKIIGELIKNKNEIKNYLELTDSLKALEEYAG